MADPTLHDLVHQLRDALGWPVVALPISPKQAWEEALLQVRSLRRQCDLWVPLPSGDSYSLTAPHHARLDGTECAR